MRAWDLTITAPHRPGTVAAIGEELGKRGVNIEGICAFEFQGRGLVHVLVTDRETARSVIERHGNVGFEIETEREVILAPVEDRPGALGEFARRVADEGINLTTLYLATSTRLVMGADDLDRLETALGNVDAAMRSR